LEYLDANWALFKPANQQTPIEKEKKGAKHTGKQKGKMVYEKVFAFQH